MARKIKFADLTKASKSIGADPASSKRHWEQVMDMAAANGSRFEVRIAQAALTHIESTKKGVPPMTIAEGMKFFDIKENED